MFAMKVAEEVAKAYLASADVREELMRRRGPKCACCRPRRRPSKRNLTPQAPG